MEDKVEEGRVNLFFGSVYFEIDLKKCESYSELVIEIVKEVGDLVLEGSVNCNFGKICRSFKRWKDVLKYFS